MIRMFLGIWCLLSIALGLISSGCVSPKLTPESRERIDEYIRCYMTGSSEWPEAKEKWVAMGPLERQALVNFLILEIQDKAVRSRRDAFGNPEPGWRRPVKELQGLGELAVPSLLKALRARDETLALPCTEALAKTARFEDLYDAFGIEGSEEEAAFQSRLVKVLVELEDPQAIRFISKVLNSSYDWRVRATAAEVLGGYGKGPLTEEVKAALKKSVDDEDPFVASKARDALKALEKEAREQRFR